MAGPCAIDACQRLARVRGWCSTHYGRWLRNGDPLGGRVPNGEPLRYLRDGLASLTDACPTWPYAKTPAGYPRVTFEGRIRLVTHLVLEWTGRGPRPSGMEACHSCNNGGAGCWHPGHLRWATHLSNMRDAVAAGLNQGERHGMAKLTEADVRAIREAQGSHSALARRFGVARRTVADVRNGVSWRHVA